MSEPPRESGDAPELDGVSVCRGLPVAHERATAGEMLRILVEGETLDPHATAAGDYLGAL